MNALFRMVLLAAICGWGSVRIGAQTATIIPANLAAAHIGQYATVEGVVAKVFTSKNGNTFLNIGAAYPNQTFTGWIPPGSALSKSEVLTNIEEKQVKITAASGCRKEIWKLGSMLLPIGEAGSEFWPNANPLLCYFATLNRSPKLLKTSIRSLTICNLSSEVTQASFALIHRSSSAFRFARWVGVNLFQTACSFFSASISS